MINIQLSGGGLDSTALTILKLDSLTKIYVANYGQIPFQQELESTQNVVTKLSMPFPMVQIETLNMQHSFLKEANPNSTLLNIGSANEPFLRGRNLALLMYGASKAIKQYGINEPINLILGLCKENMMFDDANKQFVELANNVLQHSFGTTNNNQPLIHVLAPYIDVPKEEYMGLALSKLNYLKTLDVYGAKPELLWESFTCWTPINGEECGTCYHCTKKNMLKSKIEGLL